MKRTPQRWLAAVALGAFTTTVAPHRLCASGWDDVYEGDRDAVTPLAEGVAAWIEADLSPAHFRTGSARFDGEWWFGTAMMAAMAFGQLALERPDERERWAGRMAVALDRVLEPEVAGFDRDAWGEGPLDRLEDGDGHVAYLGYTNLALSLHRVVDPASRHAALNDRITAALARRVARHAPGLVETYPGERYPVDNTAAVASIGLHARATGGDDALVARWSAIARERWVDPGTGLLIQAVAADGAAIDAPRGSGTLLASYFLAWADPALSRELWLAARDELGGDVLGFGVMREYPRGVFGLGDIDSGPVVFGWGVSATGFALGPARRYGDRDRFLALGSTATLFGAPYTDSGRRGFVTGGPLGDAILLAMVTAPREAP